MKVLAVWFCLVVLSFMGMGLFVVPVALADETAAGLVKCDLPVDASLCTVCKEEIKGDAIKFAAYMKEGKAKRSFHDIGSMLVWRDKQCMSTTTMLDEKLIVRDYTTCEEVAIGDAFFVVRTGVATPHDHGIVAFKDRASAEALNGSHAGSSVMTYEELIDARLADVTKADVAKAKAGEKAAAN